MCPEVVFGQYFLYKKSQREADMYSGKVEICGVNTSKLPVLSDEKKLELLRRSKAGDDGARRELIDG